MSTATKTFNSRQQLFKEIFVGTLIYAVVLGFFSDYTYIVYAKSFSTIFFAALVLEVLTYLAFKLKSAIVLWLRFRQGVFYKVLMLFCVWLVMFFSKFVFIWCIDFIFGNNININGFLGILLIVLCVTIIQKLANMTFTKLGDNKF